MRRPLTGSSFGGRHHSQRALYFRPLSPTPRVRYRDITRGVYVITWSGTPALREAEFGSPLDLVVDKTKRWYWPVEPSGRVSSLIARDPCGGGEIRGGMNVSFFVSSPFDPQQLFSLLPGPALLSGSCIVDRGPWIVDRGPCTVDRGSWTAPTLHPVGPK